MMPNYTQNRKAKEQLLQPLTEIPITFIVAMMPECQQYTIRRKFAIFNELKNYKVLNENLVYEIGAKFARSPESVWKLFYALKKIPEYQIPAFTKLEIQKSTRKLKKLTKYEINNYTFKTSNLKSS